MDITPAELLGYSLDLDSGELVLTFNDAVSVGSFRGDALTFQSSPSSLPGQHITLSRDDTYPSVTARDSFVLSITISEPDLNRIKQVLPYYTSLSISGIFFCYFYI